MQGQCKKIHFDMIYDMYKVNRFFLFMGACHYVKTKENPLRIF